MLGKALDLLDELGERNNTIVVFHSDHGYQLGELNEWSKKTNTELATRVPLLIRAPWKGASAGARSSVRAELVDLYRTLVDLTGLDAASIQPDVQGVSLAPLFDAPGSPPPALASKPAFSQIGSCACKVYSKQTPAMNWTGQECDANRCAGTNVTNFDFMGYTMLTSDGLRFTAWAHMDNRACRIPLRARIFAARSLTASRPTDPEPARAAPRTPALSDTARVDWSQQTFHELYNLTSDPHNDFDLDAFSQNVAGDHPALVATLLAQLKAAVLSWY